MILVTGPDNSGKTLLKDHLVSSFDLTQVPRYHTLPPVDYDDYESYLADVFRTREHQNLIMDRGYIDEFVYGPVVRNLVGFSQTFITATDDTLARLNPLVIVCDPGRDAIQQGYEDRVQYPSIHRNLEVQRRYKGLMMAYPYNQLSVIVFNYTEDSNYQQIDHLVSLLRSDPSVKITKLWRE